MIIFVYGTLMSGLQREEALFNSAFLGTGYINGSLYDLGSYPGLKHGSGKVFGELYEIDLLTLDYLDQIEGFFVAQPETSLYIRQAITATKALNSECCIAETYFYNMSVDESHKIITGDYRDYIS